MPSQITSDPCDNQRGLPRHAVSIESPAYLGRRIVASIPHTRNMATSKKLFGKTTHRLSSSRWGQFGLVLLANVLFCFIALGCMATMTSGRKVGHAEEAKRNSKSDVSALRSRLDWDGEEIPDFCHEIKKHPQPLRKNCSTAPAIQGAPTCDPNHPMMFSQYGEDYYLYTRHFSKYKKPGVYLDIATNEAIQISNTYFMDRCLSWKGICVEANPRYYEKIHRERSCALVPTCISKADGVWVEFAMSGPGGGIISTHRQGEKIRKHNNYVVKQKCVSVSKTLRRYGVSDIDYLNLDVEGHELEVLKSFDWDNTKVKVISVEIAPSTAEPIREFLEAQGFGKHDNEKPTGQMEGMPIYRSNHFYVHQSITFGDP